MPPIPHPIDMPKKTTIHSLCSPLNVPQQQNNSLGLPLSSTNKQRSLYNPLNVELSSTTAKQLALFTLQLYHHSLKLALYQSTSPHATLHAEIYQPTFKTLTGSSNVSKSWKETTKKSKETVLPVRYNGSKVQNVASGDFHVGSTRPRRTFVPGQCMPPSTIMQFRRNVYEYSTKKLSLSLPYAK